LTEKQALTFEVPINYTVSGTTYQGIPLVGVAISAFYAAFGPTATIANLTATGFPPIVLDAVSINATQQVDATSVALFNNYGFNGKNLFEIQDTLSNYILGSVSTVGIQKQIIFGLLIE
jgi:hypothetical protein